MGMLMVIIFLCYLFLWLEYSTPTLQMKGYIIYASTCASTVNNAYKG